MKDMIVDHMGKRFRVYLEAITHAEDVVGFKVIGFEEVHNEARGQVLMHEVLESQQQPQPQLVC